jgi:hypothetical protein
VQTVNGNRVALLNVLVTTSPQSLEVSYDAQEAPNLSVSPATLSFCSIGGSLPDPESVSVANLGESLLEWTATADLSAPAWLSLTPSQGVNNGTFTVSANPSGLAPGTYTKSITVTAPGAVNSPQSTAVTLTVSVPTGAMAWGQDSGPQGWVAFEAEDYDSATARSDKHWTLTSAYGASGRGVLQVSPNTGITLDADYARESPQLDYRIQFTRTGTYYVWVRGWAPTDKRRLVSRRFGRSRRQHGQPDGPVSEGVELDQEHLRRAAGHRNRRHPGRALSESLDARRRAGH